jgi:Transglycosylase SLT domain
MRVRSNIALGCRWLVAPALAIAVCAGQAAAGPVDGVCAALARQAERAQGIPSGLVEAVALAESGRWLADEGTTRPWPWTVTAGSESFFFASKREALHKVHELRSAGRSNIDVGCMQINLGYHGDAFASVAEALEPAANVAYGAQFLRQLREETESWARATARYHSRHPQRGQAYREKVYRFWEQVRGVRVADDVPTRLVGGPLVADAAPTALAPARPGPRLIVPGRAAADRRSAAGGIPILRGSTTSLRDG